MEILIYTKKTNTPTIRDQTDVKILKKLQLISTNILKTNQTNTWNNYYLIESLCNNYFDR